jgi:hypothetical protein
MDAISDRLLQILKTDSRLFFQGSLEVWWLPSYSEEEENSVTSQK